MSGNNFTCRDKYYNYGSYLRSRGYDKEICSLVTDIENGNIPIGPITPGSCPNPTIIEGNVTITTCDGLSDTGILRVNGGTIGTSTSASPLSDAEKYGLQVKKGAYISGPIIQTSVDCSHNNYFSAGNHIFNDPSMGCLSTNVIINGDFSVTGDVSYNKLTVYDLSVINVLTVGTSTTYIDTSSVVTTELSANQIDVNTLQASEISCTGNIDISNNLLVGGSIIGTSGELIIAGFTGDIDIGAGTPSFYDKNVNIKATDVNFNVDNVNFYDASVNFTKNPIVTNDISGTPRTLVNFGETITILDASANTGAVGQQDISFNISYTNIDNSSAIFQDSKIDFSNNQAYFENSILEVSYSVNALFSNQADALSVSFKEAGGSTELFLDTRTIKNGLGARTICFGPQTFIFKDGYPDNNYIEKQWSLNYDISGGNMATIATKNGRLSIKQKSLV
tara:strand:- start:10 stop:1359 length:1350 start_codon:yes stop_codon:yes gene_type:complete